MNFDDFKFDDIDDEALTRLGLLKELNSIDSDELKILKSLKKLLVSNGSMQGNICQFKDFLYMELLSKLSKHYSEYIEIFTNYLQLLLEFYEFSQKNVLLDFINNLYCEIVHGLSFMQIKHLFQNIVPNNQIEFLAKLSIRVPVYISYSANNKVFITNEIGGLVEVSDGELAELDELLTYSEKFGDNFYDMFSITILTNHHDFKDKVVKLLFVESSEIVDLDRLYHLMSDMTVAHNSIKSIVESLQYYAYKMYDEYEQNCRIRISLLNRSILDEGSYSEKELEVLEIELKESKRMSKDLTIDRQKILSIFEGMYRLLNINHLASE